jgi:putative ABC transport system permease protein
VGVPFLILRLALRDLRRRRGAALLLFLAIAATTTTLALGLAVRSATERPWDRTRAVTAGPDVVVTATRAADLTSLTHAPGVTAAAGPYSMRSTDDLRVRDIRVGAVLEGRDAPDGPVDRPRVTAGTWARSGGVVIERAFAGALGVHTGDRIAIGGRRLTVAGIAITAARVPYPSATPGLVWVTRAELRRLGPPTSLVMPVRLADPSAAPRFAHDRTDARRKVRDWRDMGAYATAELRLVNGALLSGTWALALLATASVAVLAGGRLAEQTRRAGLLKAVGATPRLVAAVLLAEHVLLALGAAATGLLAGWAVAPLLARPGGGLADVTARPQLTLASALLVTAVAVAVTGAATLVPAIRGARISTVRALTDRPRAPRRSSRLIAFSARLPVPFLLGVRLAARRPRRTALAVAGMTITVAMVVTALALHGDVARKDAQATGIDFVPGAGNPVTERLSLVVLVLMAALLILAGVNAVLVAWAGVLDARRSTALARALGATPRQIAAGLSAAQLIPATIAAALGIPLGVLVYDAARAAGGAANPPSVPYAWLPLLVPGTLAVVALLTAIPVRAAGRRPAGPALGIEG